MQNKTQNKLQNTIQDKIQDTNQNINTAPIAPQSFKPEPVASCSYFEFNDLKKGQKKHCHFIIRNIGAPFGKFEIKTIDEQKPDESPDFLKILELKPLEEGQKEKLPLKVFFEVIALEWNNQYSAKILINLDDAQEVVTVKLNTQTKPVNDFANIFTPADIKKITSLINKLEKITSAEIAVVTTDSLEGKTLEKFANELFNEWRIGKEDKNNGVLFLINVADKKFRIEVGLGLENVITLQFISNTSEKYIVPNFKLGKYGRGTYLALTDIFAEIYRDFKKH